jgi:hypothetical protein
MKRDDYPAILAVNRHAITPTGWVQKQDNSTLVSKGAAHMLVREIGVNAHTKGGDFVTKIADDYWAKTKEFCRRKDRVGKA